MTLNELRALAVEWQPSQSSALYAFVSTGTIQPGLTKEIIECFPLTRSKKDRAKLCRLYIITAPTLTMESIQGANEFWHTKMTNSQGFPICCRKNGSMITWKTRQKEFRQPVKYGLKECFYIDHNNAKYWVVAP